MFKEIKIVKGDYMEKRGEGVPIILNESLKLSNIKLIYKYLDNSELFLTIFSKKNID